MNWFFDGLGTFLIGVIIGAGGDRFWLRHSQKRVVSQKQTAGPNAQQMQVGGDFNVEK